MATMSTATALVAHDHTLASDPELLDHMCILTIARGDGTLFDADSLQKEDVVELCFDVEQAHLKAVLLILAMELVVTF